ncbi:hypothetical protein BJP40_06600 [Streptomyces sp. CC53]|uniref:DUF7341 domain-containing protein n=1 Tax=Streptomyces sp. CC53 TaxID=1906740 RepID=UPI0008DD8E5E|nr:hypothetical protein [Streptomyces sp. CC53]OII61192.1 hypothetical protein BJP40_06600 [Streptomyces sp. CC53]
MSMREIERNVAALKDGYDERIEYRIRVNGDFEERANTVRMAGLLEQLRKVAIEGGRSPAGRAARRPPNKPGSQPPGRTDGLTLLDEITGEVYYWVDRVLMESGRDRTLGLSPMPALLDALVAETRLLEDTHPALVADIADATRTWVRRARRLLGHDESYVMLEERVCGECGGALAVARDASTAVRCVGSPDGGGCGARYERDTWLGLLVGGGEAA